MDAPPPWASAAGNTIALTHHLRFPHSLGLLYSAFTYYCGFKVNSGEYKLMGLAPYGRPVYVDVILQAPDRPQAGRQLLAQHGLLQLLPGADHDQSAFPRVCSAARRESPKVDLEQRHVDLAASIQAVTEEVMLRMGRDLHRRTGLKNLVLAGGVALNCVANGRLLREGPFESIWIQPAAGDAGGALGAALFVWHQLLGKPRRPEGRDAQKGSLLGPRVRAR